MVVQNGYPTNNCSYVRGRDFGQSGLWRLAEKTVGAACWNVRQLFRTVTFTKATVGIGHFILPLYIEHSNSSLTQGKFHIFLITDAQPQ